MKHRQSRNQETSKLQGQIDHSQDYQSRTLQPFPHDITIDNKSGKDLRLTINIEDVQRTISRLTSQNIPNNSSVTHIVNGDYYSLYGSQSAENIMERSRYADRNQLQRPLFPIRQQQKFLPISRIQVQQSKSRGEQGQQDHSVNKFSREATSMDNEQLGKRMRTGNEILISGQDNEEEESDIINNQEIQQLKQSQYIKNAYLSERKGYQNTQLDAEYQYPFKMQETFGSGPINLPFSIKKSYKIVEPQTQETTQKQHPMNDNRLNTKQSFSWSLKTLENSSMKKADKAEDNHWKVQMITPTPTRLQFKIDSEKTYLEIQKEKSLFKKQKNQQRQSRADQRLKTTIQGEFKPRNSHYRCVSNSKQQQLSIKKSLRNVDKEKKQPNKADDLFIQRKDEYLRKLQRQKKSLNSIRSRSSSKDKYIFKTTFITIQRQPNKSPSKNITMSPSIQQIGNRLHSSKGKIPCEHYNKFSKSQERERFNLLVKQNIYVSRYISREEREDLFQSLIRSQDSVTLWATKIANFTFSKIRKVTTSRQRQFY